MKVSVASGKGGTGKTTLSTNLAVALARSARVVLVDLDVEEPNADLFVGGELRRHEERFKAVPRWEAGGCTLCGHCQEVCNFNAVLKLGDSILVFPELCHGCHACSELCPTGSLPMQAVTMGELKEFRADGLDFVESRLRVGEAQAAPLVRQTVAVVGERCPSDAILLFDAPPGTSCPVIAATKDADLVILVTEPTPFGLHDLSLAVEMLRQLGKAFVVVLNRHGIGDDKVERFCEAEDIRLVARIPNSRRIAEACAAGRLLPPEESAAAAAIDAVAETVLAWRSGERP